MIQTSEKNLCCGCETCGLVCPKNCIVFEKDVLGHKYAKVDEHFCVDCKKCESVCPMQKHCGDTQIGCNAYVVYSKDADIRKRASSGVFFETIATRMVDNGGYVFASKFDENLKLKCFEAKNRDEVKALTKSKYLQSECSHVFPVIRQYLQDGKNVLFVSSPCQVAALKAYLGKIGNSDNLYLLDFFCHGVPSQDFFDKCIHYVEQKKDIVVRNYEFRSKIKNGKTPHYYTLTYEKNHSLKKKTSLYISDPFYLGFQKYITLRESCYNCPYGAGNHVADLTMGDFHNVDKYIGGINRFDGVSLVIQNSQKGLVLWNLIKDSFVTYDVDVDALYRNKEIYAGGTHKPASRDDFLKDVKEMDMNALVDKWLNEKREWKKQIYYRLPDFIRNNLKRLMGL